MYLTAFSFIGIGLAFILLSLKGGRKNDKVDSVGSNGPGGIGSDNLSRSNSTGAGHYREPVKNNTETEVTDVHENNVYKGTSGLGNDHDSQPDSGAVQDRKGSVKNAVNADDSQNGNGDPGDDVSVNSGDEVPSTDPQNPKGGVTDATTGKT